MHTNLVYIQYTVCREKRQVLIKHAIRLTGVLEKGFLW